MGMTREEFSRIVKGLKAVYADPKFIADQDAFDMWYALLNDFSYEECSAATQQYMMQETKIPVPADIRAIARERRVGGRLNGNEAWALVYKAICNSTYNAESEFMKLPPIVQKCIGSPDNLRNMAMDEHFNEGVEQSHFIRIYDTECKRSDSREQIPEGLRVAMERVTMIGVNE